MSIVYSYNWDTVHTVKPLHGCKQNDKCLLCVSINNKCFSLNIMVKLLGLHYSYIERWKKYLWFLFLTIQNNHTLLIIWMVCIKYERNSSNLLFFATLFINSFIWNVHGKTRNCQYFEVLETWFCLWNSCEKLLTFIRFLDSIL